MAAATLCTSAESQTPCRTLRDPGQTSRDGLGCAWALPQASRREVPSTLGNNHSNFAMCLAPAPSPSRQRLARPTSAARTRVCLPIALGARCGGLGNSGAGWRRGRPKRARATKGCAWLLCSHPAIAPAARLSRSPKGALRLCTKPTWQTVPA